MFFKVLLFSACITVVLSKPAVINLGSTLNDVGSGVNTLKRTAEGAVGAVTNGVGTILDTTGRTLGGTVNSLTHAELGDALTKLGEGVAVILAEVGNLVGKTVTGATNGVAVTAAKTLNGVGNLVDGVVDLN